MRAALLARPNHYTFGSSASTTGHIAAALLLSQMGVTAQHIAVYRAVRRAPARLSAGHQFQGGHHLLPGAAYPRR